MNKVFFKLELPDRIITCEIKPYYSNKKDY